MVEMVGLPNPVSAFDDLSVITAGPLSFELQKSVLFGLSFLHTVFNVLNTLILVAFIPQIVKIVTKIIPTPKGEEEVFRLRFIQGGPLSTAELSLDQAKQEIIHFAEICHRETTLIREAIEAMNTDKFDEANAKLAKYEQITDKVEYEIASYLNEVSKGEISAVSVIRVREMYRIIGEMESIGDSAEAIGRMLKRARDLGKSFSEDMLKRLNRMLDLLDVAFEAMIENVTIPSVFLKDISNAQNAENNVNAYRDKLREEHILNIEKPDYDNQTGVFFTNIVQELEKMGDFIINVSECQVEESD
jgi:phosphate:Na+ symporter